MKLISMVFMNFYLLLNLLTESLQRSLLGLPEEAMLDFQALARKYGYKAKEHNVTTEDGYILRMFHIPGDRMKPVLLMHGIIDSADTFILRGRKSLAAILAEEGYDIWLGNARGSTYSRRHERHNPDTDREYWNFSFHEMAVIDLRLFIDYILSENKVNTLSLIGHSQGNTLFYALGATRPEYNAKIGLAIALAPVCFFNNIQFPLSTLIDVGPVINQWLLATTQEEVFGATSPETQIKNHVCTLRGTGYRICSETLFALAGKDIEEFEPEFFYILMGHYPCSTSRKTAKHVLQLAMQKQFAQFDYGPKKNLGIYNSTTPPVYDLSKVTMKIALVAGRNDKVTPLQNVALLRDKLPNVVSYRVMERELFNHLDHVWGKHMYKYLFPHILKLLDTYS